MAGPEFTYFMTGQLRFTSEGGIFEAGSEGHGTLNRNCGGLLRRGNMRPYTSLPAPNSLSTPVTILPNISLVLPLRSKCEYTETSRPKARKEITAYPSRLVNLSSVVWVLSYRRSERDINRPKWLAIESASNGTPIMITACATTFQLLVRDPVDTPAAATITELPIY
jgi:hypothetical protein